ncbi:amidohydrolase family protein [Amycolatopsis sp. CA-161197]|uniref:amidohydrolase family protein n=1 Tax=Amycolatopsis sp. CA-161197 TaxID=3239922 RepID=UPI003D94C85D
MWCDTVGHDYPAALRAAVDAFGADRLVLGSDFPYLDGDEYRGAIKHISGPGLADGVPELVLDHNAAALVPFKPAADGLRLDRVPTARDAISLEEYQRTDGTVVASQCVSVTDCSAGSGRCRISVRLSALPLQAESFPGRGCPLWTLASSAR